SRRRPQPKRSRPRGCCYAYLLSSPSVELLHTYHSKSKRVHSLRKVAHRPSSLREGTLERSRIRHERWPRSFDLYSHRSLTAQETPRARLSPVGASKLPFPFRGG